MNTKILMTASSILMGIAGIFALFEPGILLSIQGSAETGSLSILVQLTGSLYFAFAMMNWTAKDSLIGGIYARPVSMANFSHFFAGVLLLVKYQFSYPFNVYMFVVTVIYVIFAACFYWLVFRATGLKAKE